MNPRDYSPPGREAGRPSRKLADFLTRHGKVRIYDAGKIVFHEGDTSHWVYIILSGEAEVLRADEGGQENVIATVGPGSMFGEMGLFHDLRRTGTIRARESLKVVVFSNDDFMDAVTKLPELTVRVIRSLSNKVVAANELAADLRSQRDRWAVAYAIVRQWPEQGERAGPEVVLDPTRISTDTGVSRPGVKAVIRELARRGAIITPNPDSSGVIRSRVDYARLEQWLADSRPDAGNPDESDEAGTHAN